MQDLIEADHHKHIVSVPHGVIATNYPAGHVISAEMTNQGYQEKNKCIPFQNGYKYQKPDSGINGYVRGQIAVAGAFILRLFVGLQDKVGYPVDNQNK